jgi:hypothetical protein
MRRRVRRGGRLEFGPWRVWWLELREDGRAIVAAGPLSDAADADAPSGVIEHRFPNVAVGPAGRIRLVYLERRGLQLGWHLRSVPIKLDKRTGRPAVVGVADGPAPGRDPELQAGPLVVSADGVTVYALSRSGGLAALPAAGGSVARSSGR